MMRDDEGVLSLRAAGLDAEDHANPGDLACDAATLLGVCVPLEAPREARKAAAVADRSMVRRIGTRNEVRIISHFPLHW